MVKHTDPVRASHLDPHTTSTYTQGAWRLAWWACGWIGPDRGALHQAYQDAAQHNRLAQLRGEEVTR